jgi:hypothetical protein
VYADQSISEQARSDTMREPQTPGQAMEYAFRKQQEQLTKRQQELRDRENQKRREEHLERLESERAAKEKEHRDRAEAELRESLQELFLRFNPAASPQDFAAAYPALRAAHMAREAVEGPEREKRALRATGGYRM